MGDEQIHKLIATNKRMATDADAHTDGLSALAQRHGWNSSLTERVDELRHQAKTNRDLAQEVRDSMGE
jgi:hypothetical protein